jgi:CubicO group peptidase (beta-lactamase class C family)
MLKRETLLVIALLLTANTSLAQLDLSASPQEAGFLPDRMQRIDQVITEEIENGTIPGAVALVARQGKVVYFKGFGHADIATGEAMRKDHIFRIASMTKAVTTVAAMILYEEGRFQLNDPISRYIPAYTDMSIVSIVEDGVVKETKPATKPIRIIDLMTHSAGLSYAFLPGKLKKSYTEAGVVDGLTAKDIVLADQMKALAKQPLLFEPGTSWAYGLSTDLLGYFVEVVSGIPLDRFFAERIFEPLGMEDTYFYLPPDKAERLVTLYADVEGQSLKASDGTESDIALDTSQYPIEGARSYFSGGAGLSSTTLDYARFIQMLLNEGRFNGTRILSRKSVELMRSPRADIDKDGTADFGLGFLVTTDLGKSGELGSVGAYRWGGAFNTGYWIAPAEEIIGVVMTQVRPTRSRVRSRFPTAVYQSLD